MGIRGLTTFIANSPKKYLEYYELHDTYLVIDGNNIASHLYKWHCTRNDCFGGDYDKYGKVIYDFFKLLSDCHVIPIIVFDGGYENKKLKTVYSRMKNKIRYAKTLNSVNQGSGTLFPIFLRDIFAEIALRLELNTVRCDFEADHEMACLAKNLNCPILSYDSDFYVFDVLYIPFSSFEMNLRRVKHSSPPKYCINCQLYKIENFLKSYGGMKKENLPLMATLLGNDYIKSGVFKAFYNHVKLPKHKYVKSDQHKKIVAVIKWLQNETYESAITKILSRLKTAHRKLVADQIQLISNGYLAANSTLIPYLNLPNVKSNEEEKENLPINLQTITDKLLNETNLVETDSKSDAEQESDADDSCSESDSECCSLNSIELSKETTDKQIPEWFIEKFRKCEYPSAFMDILNRNTYFCSPQVEDYSNICSHHISATILSAVNKILSSGTSESLTYTARSENCRIKKYTTPGYDKKLPTLSELEQINGEAAKTILFEIVEFNLKDREFINDLPPSWQLYVSSIIYWIRNAKPKVAYCHVYSIILCMLTLTKVDVEVGFCRSNAKFFTKFQNVINNITEKRQTELSNSTPNKHCKLTELLANVTYDDCLLCLKEFIPYFQMDQKMTTHFKLFDVHVVDCFAQFQSCLMHLKFLNLLLNSPFVNFIVSDFYDGTFLFNMSINLMKRNNADAYVNILLKNSPTILRCFDTFIKSILKILTGDVTANNGSISKKRRKKKKNKLVQDASGDDCSKDVNESSEGDVIDVNNRFCLLKLVE